MRNLIHRRYIYFVALGLFLIAFLVRLPGLDTFFTADEFLWVGRSRDFLEGLINPDFVCALPDQDQLEVGPGRGLECTLRTGHPGVLTMWTGSLGIVLQWLFRPESDHRSLLTFVQQLPNNPVKQATIAPVRFPTVFLTALFVSLVYLLLLRLFKPAVAAMAALLVALNPFHIALSRVLHHDALSTIFIITASLSLIIYFGVDRRWRWLWLAGFLAGIAMLSKSTGFFLIPYAGLLALWAMAARWARGQVSFWLALREAVIDGLQWAALTIFSFVLFWPAMWLIPWRTLNVILSIGTKYASGGHAKGVFFFDTISQDPGPLFYPAMWFFRTNFWSMLGVFIVFGLGLLYFYRLGQMLWTGGDFTNQTAEDKNALSGLLNPRRFQEHGDLTVPSEHIKSDPQIPNPESRTPLLNDGSGVNSGTIIQKAKLKGLIDSLSPHGFDDKAGLLIWIGAFIFFFLLASTLNAKKQDRYVLPLYPMLDIVASVGLLYFLHTLSRLKSLNAWSGVLSRWGLPVLFTAVIGVNLVLIWPHYPYYFSYYNPLVGGTKMAARTVTIGWGEGLNEAAAYLNSLPQADQLKASSWYGSTFAPFFKGETIRYSDQKGNALAGDYVVIYVNQIQRDFPDGEIWTYLAERYDQVHTISLAGAEYAWIFEGPGIDHYVEDQTYRGIASLLAWQWEGDINPDDGPVQAGTALSFSLFWEYLGKRLDEPFFLRLVGPDGYIWAEGQSQVSPEFAQTAAWREGQIIQEEGILTIPSETPPGVYSLVIGFYTSAPAVTQGELTFPVPYAPLDAPLQTIAVESGPVQLRASDQGQALLDLRLLNQSEIKITDDQLAFDLFWLTPNDLVQDYQAAFALVDLVDSQHAQDGEGEPRWQWPARPLIPFLSVQNWPQNVPLRSRWSLPLEARTPGGVYDLQLILQNEADQVESHSLGSVTLPGRVRNFERPAPETLSLTPLETTFADAITLLGAEFNPDALAPGAVLEVTLFWRATQTVTELDQDYTVFLQLLGPEGQVLAQQDAWPQDGQAPTSTWTPGEILRDTYTLSLPSDLPSGPYRLISGFYLLETGRRLPTEEGDFALIWSGIYE